MRDDSARQHNSSAGLAPTDIDHFKERLERQHETPPK